MKNKIITLFVLFMSFAVNCQTVDSIPLYQNEIEHYNNMRITGNKLVIISFLTIAGGGVVYTQGINNMKYDATKMEGQRQYGTGWGIIMCGFSMFVTGAILGEVGDTKMKYYQKLSVGMIYDKNCKGLTLSYKF